GSSRAGRDGGGAGGGANGTSAWKDPSSDAVVNRGARFNSAAVRFREHLARFGVLGEENGVMEPVKAFSPPNAAKQNLTLSHWLLRKPYAAGKTGQKTPITPPFSFFADAPIPCGRSLVAYDNPNIEAFAPSRNCMAPAATPPADQTIIEFDVRTD